MPLAVFGRCFRLTVSVLVAAVTKIKIRSSSQVQVEATSILIWTARFSFGFRASQHTLFCT